MLLIEMLRRAAKRGRVVCLFPFKGVVKGVEQEGNLLRVRLSLRAESRNGFYHPAEGDRTVNLWRYFVHDAPGQADADGRPVVRVIDRIGTEWATVREFPTDKVRAARALARRLNRDAAARPVPHPGDALDLLEKLYGDGEHGAGCSCRHHGECDCGRADMAQALQEAGRGV